MREEKEFWEEYGKIYSNLEKACPYRNLSKVLKEFLEPGGGEIWLDVGCGPLKVSELIYEKSGGKVKSIEAIDIFLKPAEEKLAKLAERKIFLPVELRCINIEKTLPYPDNCFDGVGANLVLPYITSFNGQREGAALEGVLKEIFRILKPGGQLVWSTPQNNVNFIWVFMASIPDMLNIYEYIVKRDFTRILQGARILKHALQIQKKGKNGIYCFLSKNDLEATLTKIGFIELKWKKTFAQQVLVNRAIKSKQ